MINRIVEISETAAYLSYENHLMKMRLKGEDKPSVSIPVSELQCVVLATPAITVTGALLSALAEAGVIVVVSGNDRIPSGMMLPLSGHYIQGERFRYQIEAPLPLKKRLWQIVIRAKISQQAKLLEKTGRYRGLEAFAEDVKSGDSANVEGHVAAIYWKNLFRVPFVRDRDARDSNILLNYGYAILRAMAARACCACGLHPSLGIAHHNRYDHYVLADDLMEPFRPIVDRIVLKMNPMNDPIDNLTKEMRFEILQALLAKQQTKEGEWSVSDLLRLSAEGLARSFEKKQAELAYFL